MERLSKRSKRSPAPPSPCTRPLNNTAPQTTTNGVPIVNITNSQIREYREGRGSSLQLSKGSKSNNSQLVRVPNIAERSRLYAEAAQAIGERESFALPYHGGRMWKCQVKIQDGAGASGDNGEILTTSGNINLLSKTIEKCSTNALLKGGRSKVPTPLFRWKSDKLELASLPHILSQVTEVDSKMAAKKSWKGLSDDEFDSSDEEWDDYLPKPTKTCEISNLSKAAWEDTNHPLPTVSRTWISPDLQRFTLRQKALDHAKDLVEKDLLIDKILHGYGKDGLRLYPAKPSKTQALEAGMARFERDGIWVVGQEELWIEGRREQLERKLKKSGKLLDKDAKKTKLERNGRPSRKRKAPDRFSFTISEGKKGLRSDIVDPAVVTESDTSCIDYPTNLETLLVLLKNPPPPSTHWRLSAHQIEKCHHACFDHFERVMYTVKARSLHHELSDGFDVLRERGRGRYDMELPAFDTEAFSFLTNPKKTAWMPIVRKILGADAVLVHKGCFLSLPGSETQVYHQDGLHLNTKCQKPCHAVNVFVPLIDCDIKNGPTEFCLGTHFLGYENFVKEMVYTPCVSAGTPIIFDYRLGHRGLKNSSVDCRPIVYLTYSSVASGKEFRDSVNFSRKRYRKLGDFVERPLSREERAKKRRETSP